MGGRVRVVHPVFAQQLFAPRLKSPLKKGDVGGYRYRLQKRRRLTDRGQRVPANRYAVAAHVAKNAAALPCRVPEPWLVRAAMLLRRARQGEGAHRSLLGLELRQLRAYGFHENLVLQVCRPQIRFVGEREHASCLGEVSRQRLFAQDAFQRRALIDGVDDLLHDFEPREVGSEYRDGVDVVRHLGNVGIHDALAESLFRDGFREFFGSAPADYAVDVHVPDLRQGPRVELRHETRSYHSQFQRLHAAPSSTCGDCPRITDSRKRVVDSGRSPLVPTGISISVLSFAGCLHTGRHRPQTRCSAPHRTRFV